jgi:outer membrane lipoprotein SlyB
MSEIRSGVSPIVAIAAGSVIVFSALGVGVITGIIPSSFSRNSEETTTVKAEPPKAVAPVEKRAAPHTPSPAPAKRSEPVRVATAEAPAKVAAARVCTECGTVLGVDAIQQKGEGSGLGAIGGAVVGGVLGNQVGRGTGRTVATVAGAAGGALAGNEIEKYAKSGKRFDVAVRMEDGTVRHFPYSSEPAFRAGDKVRVDEGTLAAR